MPKNDQHRTDITGNSSRTAAAERPTAQQTVTDSKGNAAVLTELKTDTIGKYRTN
jgi:hypothetical protein